MNDLKHPAIDVAHLAKSFNGVRAVVDLSLQIQKGTILGFLGANGSGKTTSLRLLGGLITPDSGKGQCVGYDLFTQIKSIQANIGYMPQQFCLYQNLTVYENLDFIARIYGIKNRNNRLKEIIELLQLTEKSHQLACTLSGGWKQRVSLAAALLHHPQLLLLDEPTAGIDPQSRLLIWSHIQNMARQGITVLLSTHLMDEAERCHQLAYLSLGKVIAYGSVAEIIRSAELFSWRIRGDNLAALKALLIKASTSIQLIEKGNEIRISSLQRNILNQLDASLLEHYEIEATETTLEDVFVFKMQQESSGSS